MLDMYWQLNNGLSKYPKFFRGVANGDLNTIINESMTTFNNKQGVRQKDVHRHDERVKNYFYYNGGGKISYLDLFR